MKSLSFKYRVEQLATVIIRIASALKQVLQLSEGSKVEDQAGIVLMPKDMILHCSHFYSAMYFFHAGFLEGLHLFDSWLFLLWLSLFALSNPKTQPIWPVFLLLAMFF